MPLNTQIETGHLVHCGDASISNGHAAGHLSAPARKSLTMVAAMPAVKVFGWRSGRGLLWAALLFSSVTLLGMQQAEAGEHSTASRVQITAVSPAALTGYEQIQVHINAAISALLIGFALVSNRHIARGSPLVSSNRKKTHDWPALIAWLQPTAR